MSDAIYFIVGRNHFGQTHVIGVRADVEAATERARSAFPDPDLYLSSCAIQMWELGSDRASATFDVYPTLEEDRAMRDGIKARQLDEQERRERTELALLQARYPQPPA